VQGYYQKDRNRFDVSRTNQGNRDQGNEGFGLCKVGNWEHENIIYW
jgi:hypothetical protein